jgi:hypothetical protein
VNDGAALLSEMDAVLRARSLNTSAAEPASGPSAEDIFSHMSTYMEATAV